MFFALLKNFTLNSFFLKLPQETFLPFLNPSIGEDSYSGIDLYSSFYFLILIHYRILKPYKIIRSILNFNFNFFGQVIGKIWNNLYFKAGLFLPRLPYLK